MNCSEPKPNQGSNQRPEPNKDKIQLTYDEISILQNALDSWIGSDVMIDNFVDLLLSPLEKKNLTDEEIEKDKRL